MLKRLFDLVLSLIGLLVTSPLLLIFVFLVWLYDRQSPFYVADRVGLHFKMFKMYKIRSMSVGADKMGIDSTSATDSRVTPIGKFVRALKIDELTQLVNVFKGDMSLVGPRPNVKKEVDLYTKDEQAILSVKPGITDISSIVFSDLGEILSGKEDANIAYNQLVRPWKSRLALFYIEKRSFVLDLALVAITAISIVSRPFSLSLIGVVMTRLGANKELLSIATREAQLVPTPPPGASSVVTTR